MSKYYISGFVFLFFSFSLFSQDTIFKGKSADIQQYKELDEQFFAYDVYEIDATALHKYASSNYITSPSLLLGNDLQLDMDLTFSSVRANNYKFRLQTENGVVEPPIDWKQRTFKGVIQGTDQEVRLTLHDDFIYGLVDFHNGKTLFIEPVRFFVPDGAANLFVVYYAEDVIPKEEASCGADHLKANQNFEPPHDHEDKNGQSAESITCVEVELAIASDYLMFLDYNSNVTDVENHNIGVMNNVATNYDDEFANEIQFLIVEQFVSTCSSCDPWTSSTGAGALLNSFTSWGPGGFTQTHDLGQLWTDRNFNGGTIGIAWLSSVCTNLRYHCLQDFTSNAALLRVLTAHEIGHNFSCPHNYSIGSSCDPPGRPSLIMDPTVSSATDWSDGVGSCEANSVQSVNNHVASRTCLSNCQPPVPPSADFDAIITNVCTGGSTAFVDKSLNNPTGWNWVFPGGSPSSSTDPNPTVTYNTPGVYSVTLTVSNANGADSETISSFIVVGPGGQDLKFFDGFESGLNQWTITNPDNSTTWTQSSVGGTNYGSQAAKMDNYNYNGNGQRDGLNSPVIDLTGHQTVTLELDYAFARYNATFSDSLVIYVSTDGGATFPNRVFADAENGSGNFATRPDFTNEFTPSNTSDWCYDGGFGNICLAIDLSQFGGQSNVALRFENVNDFGNNMYLDNIAVIASCQVPAPVAAFAAQPTLGCAPLTVEFIDQSTGPPTSWNWTFESGNPPTSTQPNPSVVFANPGNFDVTLTVSNAGGTNSIAFPDYINVLDVPSASFSHTIVGSTVSFTNNSSNADTYSWFFGDGGTSSETNPIHNYNQDGTYLVELIATNQCGTTTFSEIITISTIPTANFTADTTTICVNGTVNYTSLASGNTNSWNWTFEGGNPGTSTAENPSVVYSTPGTFDVELVVSNNSGADQITFTDYINVLQGATAGFSNTVQADTVSFTDLSSNADSILWEFGDGSTSTDSLPIHVYSMDSTYTITLIAFSQCGNDTSTTQITIVTLPTAGFSASQTFGCAPLDITFLNESSGNVDSFFWTFEGGIPASSTQASPTVTYNQGGTFDVTLVVSNTAGNDTLEMLDYIVIDEGPVSGFQYTVNQATVSFSNQSSDATSYFWDFGDGDTSNLENPVHDYSMDGNYTVTLIATNNCGSDTTSQSITITSLPVAGFTSNVTDGCPALTVQYTDQSSFNITSWNWQFPGGNPGSSTSQNPTVTYSQPGVYDVTLIVTNPSGMDTITQTNYITVFDLPSASFTETVNIDTAFFTNNSSDAASYFWDFGDGDTSSLEHPAHIYSQDGIYTVTLISSNQCGSDTTIQQITILLPPQAGFGANVVEGCPGLIVTFSDQSSGQVDSYSWQFPGGIPSVSAAANPTVTYNQAGTYSVTLTVTNASGNSTVTQTDYITILEEPVAGFTSTTNVDVVNFTNQSTAATSYSWGFGDNTTSTDTDPTHTYTMDGNYTVTLIATNSCGSDTTTQQVSILLPPVAGIGADVLEGCPSLTVTYEDQSEGQVDSYSWQFPGGSPSSSSAANPIVTYDQPGTYSVTLTVSNTSGSGNTTETNYIKVFDEAIAGFNSTTNIDTVSFTNQSTDATSYFWDFGDNTTSADVDPTHIYSEDGTYTVTLIASNNCGSDTTTQEVVILLPPVAGFTSDVQEGCPGVTVTFEDQSMGQVDTYAWTFTGGSPVFSSSANPTVTYNQAGTYSVTLTVSNASGSSTVTQTSLITIFAEPIAGFSTTVDTANVDFSNQSTDATSYFWDFGDNSTSTEADPTHTYSEDGTYTITLIATNSCGDDTISQQVNVILLPQAGFSASNTEGCPPFEVDFINESSDNVDTYSWTFPGGTPASSTDPSPTVTYDQPGTYDVELTVTNAVGESSVVEVGYITVIGQPVADFDDMVNGDTAQFNNLSLNATSYFWDFGDNSTSTEDSPTHSYASDGIYDVMLIATNACGADTIMQQITVVTDLIAGFDGMNTEGCPSLQVQLFNESTENVVNVLWETPGGIPETSSDFNPVITYDQPGVYDVTLTVFDQFGNSSTNTEVDYVTVGGPPSPGFNFSTNGTEVTFNNTSSNATSFEWDFGNGDTTTEENPVFDFQEDGGYIVTLTATNGCGSTMMVDTLEIFGLPTAAFKADQTNGCASFTVTYSDQSFNNILAWNWSFSGGTPATSTDPNPVVVYDSPGFYDVTLEVTNPGGTSSITEVNYIKVETLPDAGYTYDVDEVEVAFTNNSNGADSYFWNFDDNQTSTEENPTHIYQEDGIYDVMQVVTNNCGSDTSFQQVEIITIPVPGFLGSPSSGCVPLTVTLMDMSTSNTTSWEWIVEGIDTTLTSTEQNPTFILPETGFYQVTQIVGNAAGVDSIIESEFFEVTDLPVAGFNFTPAPPLEVAFSSTSTDGMSYFWNFGDNTASTEQNPVHQYSEEGTYDVMLVVSNFCGADTIIQEVIVELMGSAPVADFEVDSNSGCLPFTVTFTDQSTNMPTEWQWTFDGGTPATSTEQNPTVTYDQEGTYDVLLIASNPFGDDTIEQQALIEVFSQPVADFFFIASGPEVEFINNAEFGETYFWDFGDNSTSTEENPMHQYTEDGTYPVMLVVTNDCGSDTVTMEVMIEILGLEVGNALEFFTLYPNPNNGQFKVTFEAAPADKVELRLWNVLGQVMWQQKFDFGSGRLEEAIRVADLPSGTYIFELTVEQNTYFHKLVIE